jgi:hypothetical protein
MSLKIISLNKTSFSHLTLDEIDPQTTIHPLNINNDNFLVIMSGVTVKGSLCTVAGGVAKKGSFRTSTVFTIFCILFKKNREYKNIAQLAYL